MRLQATSLLILALLFAAASPACANPGERFVHARELMHDGKLEAALAALDSLSTEYPGNVDYAFARGLVLMRLGHDAESLEQLEQAIALAPDYEAVWHTRHKLLTRQDDAVDLASFRERAAVRFPQSTWWHAPEPEQRSAWLLLVGAGADSLSNNLPGWNNQFVEAHYEHSDDVRYVARIARDARNDVGDVAIGLAGEWRTPAWFAGGGVTLTRDPSFQARSGLEIHVGRPFGDGFVGTLRYRHRDYDNATIGTVVADVEKYVSDFRLAYSVGLSRLHGASSFDSHVLTGNWYYGEDSSLGLSLSGGREAEAIGGGRVLETNVSGVSLTGRHQFSERLGVHWWLGVHEQGDLYRRRFVGVAVSIRI